MTENQRSQVATSNENYIQAPELKAWSPGKLTVVLRAHKGANRVQLLNALNSLVAQDYVPMEILLVTDDSDMTAQESLRSLVASSFKTQEEKKQGKVLFCDCSDLQDSRSRLLNEGILSASGQYLAFLDYDDIVYPSAYSTLIDELITSGKAVAAGGCKVAQMSWNGEDLVQLKLRDLELKGSSKLDLWRANFLPIHSFVLNRALIANELLQTNQSLNRLEDYWLLLQISFAVEFSFTRMDKPVCEYRTFSADLSGAQTSDSKDWQSAKDCIDFLLRDSFAKVQVEEVCQVLRELRQASLKLAAASEEVSHKQARMTELKATIHSLQQENNQLGERIANLTNQAEGLKRNNEQMALQLDQLNAILARKPYFILSRLMGVADRFRTRRSTKETLQNEGM